MKKGFTLIELMAVVVIISLVCLLTFPNIVNQIKKSKDANKDNVEKVVISAAKKYVNDNIDKYNEEGDYCISVQALIDNDYLKEDIVNDKDNDFQSSAVFIENRDSLKFKVIDDGTCKFKVYNIGDKVKYNDINFYVISDSDENNDSVTLLKAEPLTLSEVQNYGQGLINQYGNKTGYNLAGYGGVIYYSRADCNCKNGCVSTGCNNEYNNSDVKLVIDGWVNSTIDNYDLKEDSFGYKVRLITKNELINNLQCIDSDCSISEYYPWIYNGKYNWWTMTPSNNLYVCSIFYGKISCATGVTGNFGGLAVRPVVNLYKSSIEQ